MIKKISCNIESKIFKIFSITGCCVGTVNSCEDYEEIFKSMSRLDDLGISVTLKEIQQEIFNAEKHCVPTLIAFERASKLGLTY